MIERTQVFIGGEWRSPKGNEIFEVIDPSNEELHGTYVMASSEDLDDAVDIARSTFEKGDWSGTPLDDRIAILVRLGEIIVERQDELAENVTCEMGSPISSARATH